MLCERLIEENREILSQVVIHQIQSYKTLALWNAGHFSDSLATLATTFAFYLEHFEDEEICLQVGKHLLSVFSTLLRSISENDMKPAMKFLGKVPIKLENSIQRSMKIDENR